jgi:hypothetical protein
MLTDKSPSQLEFRAISRAGIERSFRLKTSDRERERCDEAD